MPIKERELAAWRREIVDYRLRISEDMAPETGRAYWAIIDIIEACIKLSGADYQEQMELVDREIEDRLIRRRGGKLGLRLRLLRMMHIVPTLGAIGSDSQS